MPITNIDFHIDGHIVHTGQGKIRIFVDGNVTKCPVEFDAFEMGRILKIANEQLDDHDN